MPSVTFLWSTEGKKSCVTSKEETLPDQSKKWTFDNFSPVATSTDDPCFIDIHSNDPILEVEVISNARHVEIYSEEEKLNMSGGKLPPEWVYCCTTKGLEAESDENEVPVLICGSKVTRPYVVEGPHRIRLKFLSIRPDKKRIILKRLVLTGTTAYGAVAVAANKVSMTTITPVPDESTSSISANELRSMMASAMALVDATVRSTCQGLETKLCAKIATLEAHVQRLNGEMRALSQLQHAQYAERVQPVEQQRPLETAYQTMPPPSLLPSQPASQQQPLNESAPLPAGLLLTIASVAASCVEASGPSQSITGAETPELTADVPSGAAGPMVDASVKGDDSKASVKGDGSEEVAGPHPEEWGEREARGWLAAQGLAQYAQVLRLVEVLDGPGLLGLTRGDLEAEELGIDPADAARFERAVASLHESCRAIEALESSSAAASAAVRMTHGSACASQPPCIV
jgi:TolA-binding protein